MVYQSVNPFSESLIKSYPTATDRDVEGALHMGDSAFKYWRERPIAERIRVLQRAADILRNDIDLYSRLLTEDMGKTIVESTAECELCARIFEYYVKNTERLMTGHDLDVSEPSEGRVQILYQPLGIIYCVEPWNFPYYQVVRVLAPQLAAGNTVIVKHASNVPQSAEAMEKLLLKSGLLKGGFQNLFISHDQGAKIIADTRVRGVALTGSERAGEEIASQAGKNLKKCTMELGGSDPFIVVDDADVEKAAKWAVFGRHWNSGQVCTSSKRLIVEDAVYDQFVQRYSVYIEELQMGDPMNPNTTLAPLCSKSAVEDLKKQVDKAIKAGANILEIPLERPAHGAFFSPVILTDISEDNPARHQEFFGPVTQIYRVKDDREAISTANDSPYGLGGSVFTSDEARGLEIAKNVETGMIFINHPTAVKPDIPFGGVRRSGFGRELVDAGLKEFVNVKVIDIVDINAPF